MSRIGDYIISLEEKGEIYFDEHTGRYITRDKRVGQAKGRKDTTSRESRRGDDEARD